MEGYLAHLETGGRALVPPRSDITDFGDSPWEVLTFVRSMLGGGALWKKSGERREGELLLVSKILKTIK